MAENELEKAAKEVKKNIKILKELQKEINSELGEAKEPDENKILRLGKLQTDVQNWLAISLALFALTGSFVISESQNPLSFQGAIFLVLAILFGILAASSVIKAQKFRKEMDAI
jgi:hypothetical protein